MMFKEFPSKEQHSLPSVEKLQRVLGSLKDKYDIKRPQPEDFINEEQNGYSASDIEHDKDQLALKRKSYETKNTQELQAKLAADILERIIVLGGRDLEWFGEDAEVHSVSEYDDEINYIDGFIEFKQTEDFNRFSYLGMNFDVTFSSDMSGVYNKVIKNKTNLDNYRIPKLKYAHNPVTEGYGLELSKVVLGCDVATLNSLIDSLENGDREVLENNPVKDKFIIQAYEQISEFQDRYKRSANYYRYQEALAKKSGDEDKYMELHFEHMKANRLQVLHENVLGRLEGLMLGVEQKYGSTRELFHDDAVHEKIMIAANSINKNKRKRT